MTPPKTMEFMNRYAPDDHVRENLYEEPKEMPDGGRYGIIRNQGRFSTTFHLETYPFDHQVLRILFEDTVGTTAAQYYVPDAIPVTVNPKITIPGFRIGTPRLEIVPNAYPTNFGDLTSDGTEFVFTQHCPNSDRAAVDGAFGENVCAGAADYIVRGVGVLCPADLCRWPHRPQHHGAADLGRLANHGGDVAAGCRLSDADRQSYLVSYAFIILSLFRVVSTSWSGENKELERRISRGDDLGAGARNGLHRGAWLDYVVRVSPPPFAT